MTRTATSPVRVSIVVPALDEAERIEGCLRRLRAAFPDCELLVVDGGSTDGTAERAARHARTITAGRGRARQMNAGAEVTSGDVLWFVHVDCLVPDTALAELRHALADPAVVAGGLRIRFDRATAGLTWLRVTSNLRARRLGLIFGDQALFVRRAVFDRLGGFPELPLMEDLEMSLRRPGWSRPGPRRRSGPRWSWPSATVRAGTACGRAACRARR